MWSEETSMFSSLLLSELGAGESDRSLKTHPSNQNFGRLDIKSIGCFCWSWGVGSSEPTIWILGLAAEYGGGPWQFFYPRHGFTLLLTVRWPPYWTESPVASSPEACTLWQGLFLTRRYLIRAQGKPIFSIPAPTGERSSQEGKTDCPSFSVHPKAILFLLTGLVPAPLTWSGILPIPSLGPQLLSPVSSYFSWSVPALRGCLPHRLSLV